MPKLPSPYNLKKAVLYPYTAYKRHRENLESGFLKSALDLHYYRPTFYQWLNAINADGDLLHEANLNSDSLVLDVGAYFGQWAEEMVQRYNCRILAFEPDPINFGKLQQSALRNPSISPMEFGLSDRNELARMSLEFLGSTIYTDDKSSQTGNWAEVEIRDIKNVWQDLGLERVDLMKINIEGAEFPLLERMIETGLLAKVDTYLIQFHEWHPGAYRRRKKIRRALEKNFRPVWDYHFIWEKWEKL